MKRKVGRPTKYTAELLAKICKRLSTGEPLAQICRDKGMPDRTTVFDWAAANEEISQQIAHARDLGFDAIAAECLQIADDTSRDTIKTKKGDIPNAEWIARSRLRVEARLKLLAKWCPKRYGEQLQVEHVGAVRAVIGGTDA
jgi:hypothetical protein